MTLLTVILTHLPAPAVTQQLEWLRALSPGTQFAVCHGGPRERFDELDEELAVWIEDPSLRGNVYEVRLNEVLVRTWERFVRDATEVDLIYLIEYDHAVLRGDFEQALRAMVSGRSAGLYAKGGARRNDSNWPHWLRYRGHPGLNSFVDRVSVRDHPEDRYGCLGNGMLFSRAALEAFASAPDLPEVYNELLVPTAIFHLGFDVVDIDELSDLYAHVRWRPEYTDEEISKLAQAGAYFVHPFKDMSRLPAALGASGG